MKAGSWLVAPQVVEIVITSVCIVAKAPKEPEMAVAIGPTVSKPSGSGGVSGSRYAQRAVHSGLGVRAASSHPHPLVRGRVEFP